MECGANCYVNPGNKIIITIKVFFDSLDLVPNVDESYALTIKPGIYWFFYNFLRTTMTFLFFENVFLQFLIFLRLKARRSLLKFFVIFTILSNFLRP